MLKRRERPSALLSVGGRFLRIWGGLVTVLLVAVVLVTVLRSLGASLPVPFKSELF